MRTVLRGFTAVALATTLLLGGASAASPWTAQLTTGAAFVLPGPVDCTSATTCYSMARTAGADATEFLSSTDGGASWARVSTLSARQADSLSCPSAGTCFVVLLGENGLSVLETTDGGTVWRRSGLPAGFSATQIACRSATWCVAQGYATSGANESAVTSNGGATWTTSSIPLGSLGDLACPTQLVCYIVAVNGDLADITTNGAKSWKALSLPPDGAQITSLACPSAADCYFVGSRPKGSADVAIVLATTDGGRTWHSDSLPTGPYLLGAISCARPLTCVAVGYAARTVNDLALVTSDGGQQWTIVRLSIQSSQLTAFDLGTGTDTISCPTVAGCVVSGQVGADSNRIIYSGPGALSWRTATLPAGGDNLALGCWSVTGCVASVATNSSPGTVTTTNGLNWTATSTAPALATGGIACVAATTCDALGESDGNRFTFVQTANGGLDWSTKFTFPFNPVNSVGTQPYGLACPSAEVCVAAFSTGVIGPHGTLLEYTDDGGQSFSALAVPGGIDLGVAAIACSSAELCTLDSSGGSYDTRNAGAGWSAASMPAGSLIDGPVACAASSCVAVGYSDTLRSPVTLVSGNAGETWTLAGALPATFEPTALACSRASDCELLGFGASSGAPASFTTTSGGRTWTAQAQPPVLGTDGQWVALACPTATRCEASAIGPVGRGYIFALG
jgi:photosystem II stability/assembly factor-like uncharacterized protein